MGVREIIFRGKRVDNGEWVYGYYLVLPYGSNGYTRDIKGPIHAIREVEGDELRVDPDTVSQWTGLTDKNSLKVFDGDIISGEPSMHTMKVEWYRACWCGRFKDFVCIYVEPLKLEADSTFDQFDIFVIGNKWDNPELMEE